MNILARFRDFWTHPTIDAMQAQMLREIPALHWHRQQAKRINANTEALARHCMEMSKALYGAGFSISDFGRKS